MEEMKSIGIAQIGHKFIGRAHTYGYTNVDLFFSPSLKPIKKILCGIGSDLADISKQWGFEYCTEDWLEAISREDVQIVDICAPSKIHKEIVLEAAKQKKHIFCEKPLAMSVEDAEEMYEAVENAKIVHTIGFNYRKVPALAYAKQLIEQGVLGKIYHYRGIYSQDWLTNPNFPLAWRLRKESAGGGSSWDLGAHVVDLARFLVGEIAEVVSNKSTFITKRPVAKIEDGLTAIPGDEFGEVDVDDAASFLAKFDQGAMGLFEVTRYGTGHRNQNTVEVYGSKGALIWRGFEKMNELEYYSQEDPNGVQGFRTIQIGEENHPYVGSYWPAGHIIGFGDTFSHEILDFLNAIKKQSQADPSFYDGLKVQQILNAIDKSFDSKKWIKV